MTKKGNNNTFCVTSETSKIQLADIDNIIGIANICFSEPWSKELFVSELKSQESVCLKTSINSDVIAYIIARYFVDELHIMHIGVLPELRRKGFAENLVNYLISNYKAERYLLEVRTSNEAAIKLYQKFNFIILGKRKNYYSDGEDAVVMVRGNNKT